MASEIRVDKITSLSGVGTITPSPTGIDIAGITTAATLRATTGIVTSLTAVSSAKVGSGVTLSPDGDIFATGVCTATSYRGDGSNLTGISADVVDDTSPQLGGNLDTNTRNIQFGDSAASTDDRLTFGAGTDLSIYHNGTDNYIDTVANKLRIRVDNSDDAVVANTNGAVELYHNNTKQCETSANGLAFPSGKGIDFSADGQASGMTSELLDDYEEGTFAIAAASSSSVSFVSSRDLGCYTKIGRQVTLSGQVQQVSSPSGTNVRIGIPFTAASLGDEAGNWAGTVALYDQNMYSGAEYVTLLIDDGGDYARFMNNRDDNSWVDLDVDGNAYLRFTITYFAA